jgi:hypothetical protein
MPLEHPVGLLAVTDVAVVIAVGEMRGQLAETVLTNRLATPCTEGLRAGRSAVDQDEPHVPPSNEKRVGLRFDHLCSLFAVSAILRP